MDILDKNIVSEIKNRLDNYLEFDSDLLFKLGDIRIFGGAVRDSISGDRINDIDILINPNTFTYLHDFIIKNGYIFNDKLVTSGIFDIYKEIDIISEPKTFINRQSKIIQLIKPRADIRNYQLAFDDLVSNVDLTPCALSYNGNIVVEHMDNSFLHAKYRCFNLNVNAKMYSYKRCTIRKGKLLKRGWIDLDNKSEQSNHILNSINRENKLKLII